MGLDGIGTIRGNREVALRIELSGRHPPPRQLRLKAATYEVWEGRSWRRSGRSARGSLLPEPFTGFRLGPGAVAGEARISLEPIGSTGLVLPVESLLVDIEMPLLDLDAGGAVRLRSAPTRLLEYRVEIAERPVLAGDRPGEDAAVEPALDTSGIGAEIRALARDFAGEGSVAERATRIERRLRTDFRYSDEFVGRGGADPIQDFLFRNRAGHCEYFASAMVLLLRAEGIPARLVTGFLGAEASYWERGLIVRQGNAHAWVEGYVEWGWALFDPTPAAGLPELSVEGLALLLRQAYDTLVFRWDRYVLSFDFYDQVRVFSNLRDFWSRLLAQLREREDTVPTETPTEEVGGAPETRVEPRPWRPVVAALWGLLALAGGALAWRSWRRRLVWSAVLSYRRLRQRLPPAGFAVPASMPPLALAAGSGRRFPEVRGEIDRLVARYLEEAFAGRPPDAEGLAAARAELAAVERALRRHGRAKRHRSRSARGAR
jgi:transglutaminase-like putative cysteine protease